jgi:hypothetical protein
MVPGLILRDVNRCVHCVRLGLGPHWTDNSGHFALALALAARAVFPTGLQCRHFAGGTGQGRTGPGMHQCRSGLGARNGFLV